MKKLLSMVVIFCMVFILGACGSKEAGSEANGNTEDEKAKIKIEELNYQVNVEVDNGERYVMMKLTNNSKYVITNFELTYKAKKDVTNEQKNKFYDEIIPSNQWTKRAIGQKIPKLDSKCIIADTDEDDEFKFEAYGFTIDEFNEYVDKCKKLGYIVDELSFDNSYFADNTDGYNVDLDFEEKDCAIRVTIQSPE